MFFNVYNVLKVTFLNLMERRAQNAEIIAFYAMPKLNNVILVKMAICRQMEFVKLAK